MSRHNGPFASCPLYPQKRTFVGALSMSALCHKRTSRRRCRHGQDRKAAWCKLRTSPAPGVAQWHLPQGLFKAPALASKCQTHRLPATIPDRSVPQHARSMRRTSLRTDAPKIIMTTTPEGVAMQEARIELLQRMPVFGGIRADVLQFLLGLCPVVSVPANEFFFRQHDQADSMFVLEAGKAAVLKSWGGQEYLLRTLEEGDASGRWRLWTFFRAAPPSARSTIAPQSVFQPPASTRSARRQAVRADPDEHGPGSVPTAPGSR
jgi:hypothetical protein